MYAGQAKWKEGRAEGACCFVLMGPALWFIGLSDCLTDFVEMCDGRLHCIDGGEMERDGGEGDTGAECSACGDGTIQTFFNKGVLGALMSMILYIVLTSRAHDM